MKQLMMITGFIIASVYAEARKIDGVIIVNNKPKNVTFDINVPLLGDEPNFERIQYKVRYYDENGKKQTLRPDDADEIRFKYDGMDVRMISCLNTLGNSRLFASGKRIFLKLEIEGQLRLYRFYYKQTTGGFYGPGMGYSPTMTYVADDLIFQKGGGPLKQPRSLGWKKDMLEYFSDCPELREKIDRKDLRRKEIEAIVLFYNQNCAEK